MTVEVSMFSCLSDNYGFLLHDVSSGLTAAIDTPEVTSINTALSDKGWKLTHIFNTHHHFDHAGGNAELKEQWGCEVVGAAKDASRIPGLDKGVHDQEKFSFGGQEIEVFSVPGHTSGHIAYYLADASILFVGDTIFSLGCGRLFEGTASQMWSSLQKLMKLPDETVIYCAHEYTEANADFAITIEPDNEALQKRIMKVRGLRAELRPTVPTTLGLEKSTNPFLRAEENSIQRRVGMLGSEPESVFAKIRQMKDSF